MSDNNTNYQSTQTFLIECSRANSLVDTKDGGDFNAKWTNDTNFNLRRGDVVSVEMMALNAQNSSASSLEFTGDAVVVDDETKKYCDNKVLLEVFFYMNNNNTYSVGLPLQHPEGAFNALAANKDMPVMTNTVVQPNNGNIMGLTASAQTLGFIGMGVAGAPPSIRDEVMIPAQSHFIYQYNTGTLAVPVYVNTIPAPGTTPIIGIVLGATGDPNPGGGATVSSNGALFGITGIPAGGICNWTPTMNLIIEDSGGDFNNIPLPIYNMRPVGSRVEMIFQNPTIFQQAGTALGFSQGALIAAKRGDVDGSSEAGCLNYDNIDQQNQTGTYLRKFGMELSQYMEQIGKPQTGASSEKAQFPLTTYGSGANGNATTAYDFDDSKKGFRSGNLRAECNGKPYIFTRNDFFGLGAQKMTGKGFFPKLMPMTAFILLEVDELFTDAQSLANIINDKLHEALSPFDTDIPIVDNNLTNIQQYPNNRFKGSSVVPVNNAYGWYDNAVYNNATYDWRDIYQADWSALLPVKYGGATKVNPANFQPGKDFTGAGIGQFGTEDPYTLNVYQNQYLSIQYTGWFEPQASYTYGRKSNVIYGNCGLANFYKSMMGDRLNRLPLQKMNTTTSTAPAPAGGICNVGCPIITNQKLRYFNGAYPIGGGSVEFSATETTKNQVIYTNIRFPTRDLNGNLEYDPQVWIDFAETVRQYELYGNKADNAPNNYNDQNLDAVGWAMDLDLGRTDDKQSTITQAKVDNITPLDMRWSQLYPVNCNPSVADADGYHYGTGHDPTIPITPINEGYREIISPAFSCLAFGSDITQFRWQDNWTSYRGLGKLWVQTRYDANWKTTTRETKDLYPFAPTAVDTANEILYDWENYTSPDFPPSTADFEFLKGLNLGCYPYKYTDSDGIVSINVAFRCAYTTKWNDPKYFDANDITQGPASTGIFELGCITWGLPIGVSPSAMDNHVIVPMNGDQRNSIYPIKNASSGSEIQPIRSINQNWTNYVVFGANNPTFQYAPEKNRFEFLNLQTDNLLTQLNQSTQSLSTTNPQIGEKVGIVYGTQADAVYNQPDPVVRATSAENYTKPIKNQGLRAEIGGIGIFKVFLCPPDYEVPEDLNPVNYWDNSTLEATEENRQRIIKDCVEGSDENWEGSLLARLGFNIEDFIPRYGRQFNRFDPNTYNNSNVNIIGNGIKPLMLNNSFNGTINPALNLYYKFPIPTGSTAVANGVPKFLHGFNESQEVLLSTQSLPLTADDAPISTISPFYIVYSDIVANRQYQTGSTPLPAIFYCMKNYQNGSFLYGYGSSFSIMVNQDRALSQINTEIRNPTDGKLAKLSPNSVIVYKIQRQSTVPAPPINVFGADTIKPPPDPNLAELTKIFNLEKKIAGGMGSGNRSGDTGGGISNINDYKNPKHLHNMVRDNVRAINSDANLQATSNEAGTQAGVRTRSSGTQREEWDTKEMPPELKRKMTEIFIKSVLAKIPVPTDSDGNITRETIAKLPSMIDNVLETVDDVMFGDERGQAEAGEDMIRNVEGIIEDLWRTNEGNLEAVGQTILGIIGTNMRVGVDGNVVFDDTSSATKDKDDLQLVINNSDLTELIVRQLRDGDLMAISSLVRAGLEQDHIVAEGVQTEKGEAPVYYDYKLNTRKEGQPIFARLGKSYGARSDLERLLKSQPEFGGSPQKVETREEARGEEKTGSALPQRVEQLKSEKASSTAGSTTVPPSSIGESVSSTTSSTSSVEPSGKPDDTKK